jgi:hypothetical protein
VRTKFKIGMMAAASLMLAMALAVPSLGQRRNQDHPSRPAAKSSAPRNTNQQRPARQYSRPARNFQQRQQPVTRNYSSGPRTYSQPRYQAPAAGYSAMPRSQVARPPAYSTYSAQGRPPAQNPRYTPPAQREVPRPPTQNQHSINQQNYQAAQQREVAHPPAQAQPRVATPPSGYSQAGREVPRPPQAGGGLQSNTVPTRTVPRPPNANGAGHIGDWVRTHRDMPVAEQQKALQSDPTFQTLAPQQQQRLQNQLTRLNNMPPQQQQRMLNRAEVWEHLSPQQRTQVKQLHSQMQALPPDRQRMMKTAIGDLRAMPPDQREKVLDSPRFQSMFSDQERNMLRETTKLPLAPAESSVPRPTQN